MLKSDNINNFIRRTIMKAIITVLGTDKVGIIAKVCTYLADREINILDISQTIIQGYFNMLMIIEVNDTMDHFAEIADGSDGYPVSYEKGFEIKGLEHFETAQDCYCFHAGTRLSQDGKILTNGGRVLGITAKGADLRAARANAYKATEWVDFANKYMRHDIGKAIDEA